MESIDTVWYKMLMFANMQIIPNKTKHEHVPIEDKAINQMGNSSTKEVSGQRPPCMSI
jgi:hypothetical protein